MSMTQTHLPGASARASESSKSASASSRSSSWTSSRSSRRAVGIYGTLVYALFLPVFLYLIGWVGGWIVPRSLDTGLFASIPVALFINVSLVALFGAQHMIMARPAFKRWWTKIVHPAAERATFVLITCAILCLMFWQWRAMPTVLWSFTGSWLGTLLTLVSLAGWAIVFVSTFLIDHFDLFGIKQALFYAFDKPYPQNDFKVKAFYKVVRHPLYFGMFVAFWAAPQMTLGRLVFAGAMTTFVLIAVRLEERDLKDLHSEYDEYSKEVPMLLPRWPSRETGTGANVGR